MCNAMSRRTVNVVDVNRVPSRSAPRAPGAFVIATSRTCCPATTVSEIIDAPEKLKAISRDRGGMSVRLARLNHVNGLQGKSA